MSLLATPPATTAPAAAPTTGSDLRGRWPLAAIVSGLALAPMPMIGATYLEEDVTSGGALAVYEAVKDKGVGNHIAMDLAFLGAIALALFAAGFLRFLAARTPRGSGLAVLARLGMSSAVGLTFTVAILKAVYRGGLPDHMDSAMYPAEAIGVFHVILDQFQYTNLWPLTLVMAAVAVLAFRDRVLPRWYGGFSAVLLVATLAMAFVLGLPYFAGLVGPIWLVVSGVVVLRHRNRAV